MGVARLHLIHQQFVWSSRILGFSMPSMPGQNTERQGYSLAKANIKPCRAVDSGIGSTIGNRTYRCEASGMISGVCRRTRYSTHTKTSRQESAHQIIQIWLGKGTLPTSRWRWIAPATTLMQGRRTSFSVAEADK
jgi:hypothetical protein